MKDVDAQNFTVSIGKADPAVTVDTEQNIVCGVGTFTEPVVKGVDGNTLAGTLTYDGNTYADTAESLKTKTNGSTGSIGYTFTPDDTTNYKNATGTINYTMIDVAFKVGDEAATAANAVTVKDNHTYGDAWADILTLKDGLKAVLLDETVTTGFSFDVTGSPDAGDDQQYKVLFNGTIGGKTLTNHVVATGTVDVAKKELTVSAGDFKVSKVYDGTTAAGTSNGNLVVSDLVGEDSVTITPTIGAYSSANVGTSNVIVTIFLTGNANYKLKNTTVSVPAVITAKPITPTVEGSGTHTYTGSAITPNVMVKDGETALVKDKDYTAAITNNINAGMATVTITAKLGGNYTFSEQMLDFQIFKATPKVTAPTAKTGLVYNGTALELISAGSTNFGTLLYSLDDTTYSTSIPTVTNTGEYTVYYKVQGNSNVNDTTAVSISASIGKANVTVTAKSHTVKVGNQLPTFGYDVSGLVNNEALPITVSVSCSVSNSDNLGTFPIRVSGDDESTNYIFTYVNGSLTIIAKTAQTITADNVTLTYGETGKKITATTSGGGAISYEVKTGDDVITVAADGTITTLKAGTATVEITAAETDDYAKATKTITVTVNKAKPSVTAPTASAITLGQTLTDSTLSDSSWSWSDSSIQPTSAGTHRYTAVKTVDDADYYDYAALSGFTFDSSTNTLSTEVSVEVKRVGASVTPPTASNTLTYGQALSAAGLTADWTWENTSTIPDVNNTGYTAYKIVTDYNNFD